MPRSEVLEAVLKLVRSVHRAKSPVSEHSLLLTEIDLDSLQMLELIERIKERFGVDLLAAPFSIEDARSPGKIADAIVRFQATETAPSRGGMDT